MRPGRRRARSRPTTIRAHAPRGSRSAPWSASGGSRSPIRSATAAIVRESRSLPSVGSVVGPFALPGDAGCGARIGGGDVADRQREAERVEPRAEVRRCRRDRRGDAHGAGAYRALSPSPSSSATTAASAGTLTGCAAPAIAHSVSLRPWPVRMHTTVAPAGMRPSSCACRRPATLAALAGSANRPSRATSRYAARICRSVTDQMPPSEPRAASSARSHDAGLPIRIAVAIVWGSATGSPSDERRGAGRLVAEQLRRLGDQTGLEVLRVADPVARDVAGVADRHAMDVGRPPEEVADLERGRLLPLQPERVHAVDQRDRVALGEVAREVERRVEVALDLEHPGAVHEGRRHLAHRDLALGHEDRAREPGLRRVGGGRRRRVAGGGAHDRLRALLRCLRDRERHPTVLERPGGVRALVLQPDLGVGVDRQARRSAPTGCRPREA